MVIDVTLVYFAGCPHVEAAREALRQSFALVGIPPAWVEIDTAAEGAAAPGGWGSPTILVGGADVIGAASEGGFACRLYVDEHGRRSEAPSVESICVALRRALGPMA